MDATSLGAIFWMAFLILLIRKRFSSTAATLLPYQCGLLFRRGKLDRVVEGGKHKVKTNTEFIVIVDKRSTPVNAENLAVSLRDGAVAVFGFSGSVEIVNPSKVLYSAQNYHEVPPYHLLCCSRQVLNQCQSSQVSGPLDRVAQDVSSRAAPRLAASGFLLQSFKLTQLSIVAPAAKPG
jgi:hypothetical protein